MADLRVHPFQEISKWCRAILQKSMTWTCLFGIHGSLLLSVVIMCLCFYGVLFSLLAWAKEGYWLLHAPIEQTISRWEYETKLSLASYGKWSIYGGGTCFISMFFFPLRKLSSPEGFYPENATHGLNGWPAGSSHSTWVMVKSVGLDFWIRGV